MTKTTNLSTHHRSSSCPEGSPSPIMIKLEDCVQELLKFVLQSSTNGTLDFDLGLSTAFCSVLLKHDPSTSNPLPDSKADGQKTIEGKYALGKYDRLEPGMLIIFNKCLLFEILDIRRYVSFSDMLESENLQSILPGIESINEGLQILKSLNREEEEMGDSVLALCISRVPFQPYISLAAIISGLSYEGLQGLLGLAHTAGTVADVLPPPRSALLSSFVLPYKPKGKGIKLTHGAKALAKHHHRSSSKYWGTFDGNDSEKNRLAMNTIVHLIAHCCWMNIHIVAPHGIVFEIRIAQGYGARWSKDGNKFIGFLEPYMEDGHLKGWKH
ncbi:uncharacterized protein LOC103498964 isoform X3 [Cucumis melo]|uniref:Uncharacterized protein LOC103498964 isoform X3 n=1 Tax=Cucumis melo TaxID=3656 RepID=A0A1S3CC15_CUCME|nr:uncharacterized protein LOC103498964 isoform X3 [Cucumis melo]